MEPRSFSINSIFFLLLCSHCHDGVLFVPVSKLCTIPINHFAWKFIAFHIVPFESPGEWGIPNILQIIIHFSFETLCHDRNTLNIKLCWMVGWLCGTTIYNYHPPPLSLDSMCVNKQYEDIQSNPLNRVKSALVSYRITLDERFYTATVLCRIGFHVSLLNMNGINGIKSSIRKA